MNDSNAGRKLLLAHEGDEGSAEMALDASMVREQEDDVHFDEDRADPMAGTNGYFDAEPDSSPHPLDGPLYNEDGTSNLPGDGPFVGVKL